MKNKKLSTESYKGVRDFYPEDMAIQSYIFDTWSDTAESFGFQRYDASILEPAELYKSKGSENEEIINEQSYTFTDRGDREVTLRPEMTPTVARMIAGRHRELHFPIRWYSIPNLFRYERPQRGRLREHWQLNCDIFGTTDYIADVEIIALSYHTLLNLGATPEMFEIRINDRSLMERTYHALGIKKAETINQITKLNDRRRKISDKEYRTALSKIVNDEVLAEEIIMILDQTDEQSDVVLGLQELGITNVVFDKSLARGFDYYTGTIFEFFDTNKENPRALLGGGRYDNLTAMFGGEPIVGVGFGMGDVSTRNFLETHNLIPESIRSNSTDLAIVPTDQTLNLEAEKLASEFRKQKIKTITSIGTKKLGKKISDLAQSGTTFVIIVGTDEIESKKYTLKNLQKNSEKTGKLRQLISEIKNHRK
ncbi:MAG: histidine--tRNA ligase [Candidatus Paceibacterota bacterium]